MEKNIGRRSETLKFNTDFLVPKTAAEYDFWREIKRRFLAEHKNAGLRKKSVRKCRKNSEEKFALFVLFALIGNAVRFLAGNKNAGFRRKIKTPY